MMGKYNTYKDYSHLYPSQKEEAKRIMDEISAERTEKMRRAKQGWFYNLIEDITKWWNKK